MVLRENYLSIYHWLPNDSYTDGLRHPVAFHKNALWDQEVPNAWNMHEILVLVSVACFFGINIVSFII